MKIPRALPLLLSLTMLAFATTAATCSAEKAQSAVDKSATGISIAAQGIETGIDTVRAFRESGEITPERSLALARAALDANSALREAVDFTLSQPQLDANNRPKLREQFDGLLTRAQNLARDGTLHLKSGKAKLIFDLGVTAGRGALTVAFDELASAPDGVAIPVTEETRVRLRRARETILRNDERLREAIARLSQSPRD